jgi:hypothetical protein
MVPQYGMPTGGVRAEPIVSGTSHQLDRDRADAGRFWQIADRCTVLGGELSYPPYSGRRFASSLRRRAVAGP